MEPSTSASNKQLISSDDTLSDDIEYQADFNETESLKEVTPRLYNSSHKTLSSLPELTIEAYRPCLQHQTAFPNSKPIFTTHKSPVLSITSDKRPKLGRKPKLMLQISGTDLSQKPLYHSKDSSDNIRRKLKTHYIRFIINFLNALIRQEANGVQDMQLSAIDYSFNKIMSIDENQAIFAFQLREYLCMPISKKYKHSLDNNKAIVDYLSLNKPERFNGLFNKTLSEFYYEVYLGHPEKMRELYGVGKEGSFALLKKSALVFFEDYIKDINEKEPKLAQMIMAIGKELTWLYSKKIDGTKPFKFYTVY